MFEKLNRTIFQKRFKKFKQIEERERRFVNYNSAKTIMLLFESDYTESNQEVRELIRKLTADGKKVMAWGFSANKVVVSPILPDFRILNKKNCDFTQKPAESFFRELESVQFDLLLDITVHDILPLNYLTLYAHAGFKAGAGKSDPLLYDFVLDIKHLTTLSDEENAFELDASYIYNQIIFYLKSIQTSD
jgi:hypothetical protein